MCGVCGAVVPESPDDARHRVERMAVSIAHRGPDDQGVWVEGAGDRSVAIGSRRLSILDLSPAGHMPMLDDEGAVSLVFNGEIYNYIELREQLKSAGYVFRSASDTEVVLQAYKHWGPSCVERFNGMFALAIYDRRSRQMFLFRDRLGKKPLYYFSGQGMFMFASELKCLMACDDFPRTIDEDALSVFFSVGRIPSPRSIFKNTHKVPGGSYLTLDLTTMQSEITPFWNPAVEVDERYADPQNALDELGPLLEDAVRIRLRSDVPVGCIMSSGVDSSAVAAYANKANPGIETFTVGFGKADDEVDDAQRIADILGTNHHTLHVNTEDIIGTVDQSSDIFDEPLAFPAALPTYMVFKMASEYAKVILVGDGGDELFWGYEPGSYGLFRSVRRMKLIAPLLAKTLGVIGEQLAGVDGIARRMPLTLLNRMRRLRLVLDTPSPVQTYFSLTRFGSQKELGQLLSTEPNNPEDLLRLDRLSATFQKQPMESLLLYDILFNLADFNLDRVDRGSMANSVEARAPLLDYRLVEFALRIPVATKRYDEMPKYLLKQTLGNFLPRGFWDRPKKGFDTPAAEWLRGPLKERANDLVSTGSDLLSKDFLESRFRRHIELGIDESTVVWPAFVFLHWADRWLSPKRSAVS